MKIFVSAYACEPGLGSEIGVGWHWVLEMARRNRLWVLTRTSNRARIEAWYAEHPEAPHIEFVYFDLPQWARRWKKGLRGVRTYYNLWIRLSDSLVRRTMQQNDIRLFHHITYGNAMWPVSRSGSRHTMVWGPIGGLETIPAAYTRYYSWRERLRESVRRVAVALTRLSPGFRRRCHRADVILCKTEVTRQSIPARYRDKAVMMTDVAPDSSASGVAAPLPEGAPRFIAVGRLDAWRGFDIAIEAFARASLPGATLTIVGKGPDAGRLKALAADLDVADKVVFTGGVSMERYYELMGESSVVVNPALKEGAVTVAFDAMAMGRPLIAVDTTGYTRYFHSSYSVVLPLGRRDVLIADMAAAMRRMADPAVRAAMGREAAKAATEYSWTTHGEEINKIFSGLCR